MVSFNCITDKEKNRKNPLRTRNQTDHPTSREGERDDDDHDRNTKHLNQSPQTKPRTQADPETKQEHQKTPPTRADWK